jgi:glucose/arabinose dehydrogenase
MKQISWLALGTMLLASASSCGDDDSSAPDQTTDPSGSSNATDRSETTPGNSHSDSGSTNPAAPTSGSDVSSGEGAGETTDGTETAPSNTSSPTAAPSDDTSSEGETSGPPAGAYEPCSGQALPNLAFEPFLLPPKVDTPIHVVNPPGQPNMVYVAERDGAFKRFDLTDPQLQPTTLVTLSGVSTAGEMGFLSFALHPNFDGASEKRAYLVYTPAQSFIISEYVIDGDLATEVGPIFSFTGDTETNHNGGLAVFGPDGYLYVGIGDGGGGNDRHGSNGNGQNTNTHYGKILRLDVDAPDTPVPGNLTSEDVGGAMVDGRILHYGLRNPWRFSFDRVNGDLYIGDVGQDTREEIDMITAGTGPTNFGWAAREGFIACPGCSAEVFGLPAVDPIYDYENPPGGSNNARSVTGGFVYRGDALPALYGRYLFADYQTGEFTFLTADGNGGVCDVVTDAIQTNELRAQGIASFAEDSAGELYVVHLNDGIFKLVGR